MRGSDLIRQSGIPPEIGLLNRLSDFGRLCHSTGLTLADVAALPAELVERLITVQEAIDDYVSHLRQQELDRTKRQQE